MKSSRGLFIHGGPGSGHHGHRGRPGQRGGSAKETGFDNVIVSDGSFLPSMGSLKESLKEIDRITNGRSIESFVLKNGQEYRPQPLPSGIPKGKGSECYANAARLAWSNPGKYTYVEGFAKLDFAPLSVQHAWVVDDAGNVIDNTWKMPGSEYFGVPVSLEDLDETLVENEVYGVFATPSLKGSQKLMKKISGGKWPPT